MGIDMPTFCRHNRLIQNCPICSREQEIELRPIVSSSAPRSSLPRTPSSSTGGSGSGARSRGGASSSATGVRVRRLQRGDDDGYHSGLVPGLHSSADAHRLAEEMAFGQTRLRVLASDPPGLYAEVADPAGDLEERLWLAFLIAYIGPLDDDDPFAGIRAVRTTWASGEFPNLDGVTLGPRTAHEAGRGTRTLEAYRAWAERAGSQAAAFTGETAWTPERRFARVFERMALPGLHRAARFDLLVTIGRLGVVDLQPAALELGANNNVTVAAKRVLGIGDSMLLERRAASLAEATGVDLAALDLAFGNWERAGRVKLGLPPDAKPDADVLDAVTHALGL
jgi:hypothetical protein